MLINFDYFGKLKKISVLSTLFAIIIIWLLPVNIAYAIQGDDHTALVARIRDVLTGMNFQLQGPCGAFQITARVAWELQAEGAGLLSKPGGNNCMDYAVDIIVYPDGEHYDILGNSGCTNDPRWGLIGPVDDPARYRTPFDPRIPANLPPAGPPSSDPCAPSNNPDIPIPPPPSSFTQQNFPPTPSQIMTFGELIQFIFLYGLYILGISVFIMIFWAGVIWFTAGDNTSRVSRARSMIFNAIIGAILLISAYVILYTINPDLVGGDVNIPAVPPSTP